MSSIINTGELDFADIKTSLKNFLSNQAELADYDFDGSIISTLLDVLAYNTHYNALYTNMAVNEMFIDSASKRSSLSSIAKLLGYVPKSITSSKAIVNINSGPYDSSTNTLSLSAGATFSTSINDVAYTFNLLDNHTATKLASATSFTFPNVTLYEGEAISITYTKAPDIRFIIPNDNVDTGTLRVRAYDPGTNKTTVYTAASSIVDTNATDNIFFTKHIDGQKYEVYFGDGVFGTTVNDGAVVTLSYLVSKGDLGNGAAVFSYASGLDSTKSYSIITQYASAFGAKEETKESIRFFAPLAYQSQNRAVTSNDYAAIIAQMYPQIETISVWGGQDHKPPQYGKVFISVKPAGRDAFSTLEKMEIRRGILARRSVVTVTPEIIDPGYYDIEFTANVYYDPSKTIYNPGQLSAIVNTTVNNYAETLSKFESSYRHSTLTTMVDQSDDSIVSSINTIRVRSEIKPVINVDSNYSVDFQNPIASSNTSTFYSTRFYLSGFSERGYLKNNGSDVDFYTEDNAGIPYYQKTVGTIDFNGAVTLDKLNITALYDDKLEFVFYPSSYDVIPPNGTIVRLPTNKITVNVLIDKLSQVRSSKTDHIFSLSR